MNSLGTRLVLEYDVDGVRGSATALPYDGGDIVGPLLVLECVGVRG